MKTFLEFVAEARLLENDQAEHARIRAQIKMLQSRGRPGDDQKIKELTQQAGALQVGTQAKIGAALDKDKPKTPANPNTWVSGTPKSPKGGSVSSVGTQPGISRQRVTNLKTGADLGSGTTPGENVSGRFGDTRSRSQRGGSVPNRNQGQGRSTPERGSYSQP